MNGEEMRQHFAEAMQAYFGTMTPEKIEEYKANLLKHRPRNAADRRAIVAYLHMIDEATKEK